MAASRLSSKDGFAGKECECNAGDTQPSCDRTWEKGAEGRLLRGEMQFPSFLSRLFPGA